MLRYYNKYLKLKKKYINRVQNYNIINQFQNKNIQRYFNPINGFIKFKTKYRNFK